MTRGCNAVRAEISHQRCRIVKHTRLPPTTTPALACSVLAKRIQVVALHLGKASSGGKLLARSGGIQQSEKTLYMFSDMLLDLLLLLLFISGGTADIFSVPVRIIANPQTLHIRGYRGCYELTWKINISTHHFLSSKRGAFPWEGFRGSTDKITGNQINKLV